VPSRLASDAEILKAHTPEYLENIKQYVAEAAAEQETQLLALNDENKSGSA
jgi:acetoin utilization deacetylase AcuC-like enzyme